LVVEVKPGNGEPNAMAEDLIKLCHFRGLPIDYRHAIFLLYGLPIEEWDALQMRIARVLEGRDGFNPALVSILVHESAGTTAQKVDW